MLARFAGTDPLNRAHTELNEPLGLKSTVDISNLTQIAARYQSKSRGGFTGF